MIKRGERNVKTVSEKMCADHALKMNANDGIINKIWFCEVHGTGADRGYEESG